jgi:hypothetical protein
MGQTPKVINIVCDGPPGPQASRFIEVEDDNGHSINVGDWRERDGGHWALRIDLEQIARSSR